MGLKNMRGKIFNTNEGEQVVIIEYINSNEVYVSFIGYQHIVKTSMRVLKKGEIKNRLKPSVFGVGSLGYGIKSPTNHVLYTRWQYMIDRCYNKESSDYVSYGAKGVKVCDSWKCFENYVRDVEKMPNYQLLLKNPKEWQIDKDMSGSKLYSKDTCSIIKAEHNARLSSKDGLKKKVKQLTLDGNLIAEYNSITEVIEKYGFNRTSLSKCLNGKQKTAYGYKWEFA